MKSCVIRVKNFKNEDIFGFRGHSEAKIADLNFTLKNLDDFLIFLQRVSIGKKNRNPNGQKSQKITPPIAAAGLLGPDLVQFEQIYVLGLGS